jgi:hypothetical protein
MARFQPGTPKPPNSGRRKGVPNRASKAAAERLAELYCDPLAALSSIAGDEKTPLELRVKVYCELLPYIHPRLRSTEHSGPDSEPITIKRLIGVRVEDI